jgi:hypothetical protein
VALLQSAKFRIVVDDSGESHQINESLMMKPDA